MPEVTGASLSEQIAEKKALVNKLAEQMKLRQWCVEQLLKMYAGFNQVDMGNMKTDLDAIYNFVTDVVE